MITGKCTTHENPDLWFPETPPFRPSKAVLTQIAEDVKEASALCRQCPSRLECLEEGMKPENLPHGIWGGIMGGDRLISIGKSVEDYPIRSPEYAAIDLVHRLEPYLGG
jgi:hypothetical protein